MNSLATKFLKFVKLGVIQASIPVSYRVSQTRLYANAQDEDDFLNRNFKLANPPPSSRSLDIGCGADIRNPFRASELFGVDIRESVDRNIVSADLNIDPIPFEDGSFDYVTAYHFLEHVPRVSCEGSTRFPFVELMSEVSRVLKPGGLFFSHTPAYPSKEAFQDPTHVNIITEDTLPRYFCGDYPLAKPYGFNDGFELVAQEWFCFRLLTMMRKV